MEESKIKLNSLVKKRGQIKAQLTRFTTFVDNFDNYECLIELTARLEKIEILWGEFNTIQSDIEILDDNQSQIIERESFESKYFDIVAKAKRFIIEHNTPVKSLETNSFRSRQVKLPTLDLPTFSGQYEQWHQFHDTFEALVNKDSSLTIMQKFLYLNSCLKGEAAVITQSVEVSDLNYTLAWELLRNRFDNKRVIVNAHLNALIDLPVLVKESHKHLRSLVDEFHKHTMALKNMGLPTEHWDALLINIISRKLDNISKREWEKSIITKDLPTMNAFATFLNNRCQLLETLSPTSVDHKTSQPTKQYIKKGTDFKSFSHVSTDEPWRRCNFCKGTHLIYSCQNFLKLSVKSRFAEAKKLNLCINCLRWGHSNSNCKSMSCKECNERHNTLLHINRDSPTSNETSSQSQSSIAQSTEANSSQQQGSTSRLAQSHLSQSNNEVQLNSTVTTHCSLKQIPHILLSTALIYIQNNKGNLVKCRALLDSGSQSNFITRQLSNQLGLSINKINWPVTGINQAPIKISERTETNIKSCYNAYSINLTFLVLGEITNNIPIISFNSSNLKIPDNITLADPTFNNSGPIDVLLGAEVFFSLLCVGQIRLGKGNPILQKSHLGWVISGPIISQQNQVLKNISCNLSVEENIQNQLEKFWKIEECSTSSKFTMEELECEKCFVETTTRLESGRFKVTLPIRKNAPELGNSQESATKRFLSLERKLMCNPQLRHRYIEFMNEYTQLGHMSKINVENINTPDDATYYLPHHGVIRENSTTTKLRVVFDASAKSNSGISLNDILMVGPTIQDDLFSIILRFRKHTYIVTADIEKMYRQVEVADFQRNLQRIVWRTHPDLPLDHYTLNTVSYGTASAAFLAIRSLQQTAFENRDKFPNACQIILKDFYVDDLITGSDTIEEVIQFKHEISNILRCGGFPLRKWLSNDKSVVNKSEDNPENLSEYYITDDSCTKMLGLLWNSSLDSLKFAINIQYSNQRVTKRIILSAMSQIFDPLGLLGPVIIKTKIILQLLWRLKLDWDESVPSNVFTEWTQFCKQIPSLSCITIPRHVVIQNWTVVELHGFCDSSTIAYGTAIYVKSTNSFGECQIHLLCAKSRVAPLKSVTLPRLELCGALLLAQLSCKVVEALNMNFDRIVHWTDSTIVLSWLNFQPTNWKTFVANRVAEIQRLSCNVEWRHVTSSDNPADIISRGVNPEKILNLSQWWSGPTWLLQDSEHWPETYQLPEKEQSLELKVTTLSCVNIFNETLFSKYSSLTKLHRVVTYCARFKKNLTTHKLCKLTGNLTIDELNESMAILIKLVQSEEFENDIQSLKKSNAVTRSSKLMSLNPFLDEKGIIRVGGRLLKSNIANDQKHPMLLPNKHPFTKLIINYEHCRNLHAGTQATLASIRHKFWPLKGRSTVKQVLRKCITCFKVKPLNVNQIMGNLPECRLQPERPFSNCGVDYAGPFYVKDGKARNRTIVKCYLCIFICFATKAVHLELVGDMTSDSFLNALKRFTSRRGICKNIWSDNGTNFHGANNDLKEMNKILSNIKDESSISNFLNQNCIRWHFIPARSPHFGGLWEAAVKSAKYHFKRIVGNIHFTFEDLYTVFVQIEAVLNSRPLTPLSEDPNDLSFLTPSHFLIGDVLTAIPQINVQEIAPNRLTLYKRLQQILQHFWNRWKNEYLSSLQQRNKWRQNQSNDIIQIGAMVLLKEENVPPLCWPVGRIIKLHPGVDNKVRVVSVKTANNTVQRAITKICILPIVTSLSIKDI